MLNKRRNRDKNVNLYGVSQSIIVSDMFKGDTNNKTQYPRSEPLPPNPQGQPSFGTPIFGVREKLIVLFLFVKILPLVLLAFIAWQALKSLGINTQEIAVVDSRVALTAMAQEHIERITTDTAQKVAEFLYARDADISILAKMCERVMSKATDSTDFNTVDFFADVGNYKTGLIRKHGDWKVAENGMKWVQIDPYIVPSETGERSSNPENKQELDGVTFNYRPPRGFGDAPDRFDAVPLYDEIALIDLNGMQIAKYIPPGSTKKRFPFPKELVDVSDPKNTFVKAERYFDELKKLGKDDIYVSDVIGAYVPTHFIGMYTRDFLAARLIDRKIADLLEEADPANAETIWKLRVLNAELKDEEDSFNSRQIGNEIIRTEIDQRLGKNKIWKIKDKTLEETAEELRTLGFPELAEEILSVPFNPTESAFAGAENPLGIRFEGIIRWAKPVVNKNNEIVAYVTFALNQVHLAAMIDHITPTPERYTELSDGYAGNYAFIWDYKCRSIVHPRHYSQVGYNPETGLPEIPWLEKTLYDGMIAAGFKPDETGRVADWQDYIASLENYVPFTPAPDWMVELAEEKRLEGSFRWTPEEIARFPLDFQSRAKRPSPELTKAGLVGLDGRYLNTAPQCTGWMDLTRDGGSGSFYILWSGLYKLTTAAAIPYYTGQYHPDRQGGSRRGFGFVAVGAGLDDFSRPAQDIGDVLETMVTENIQHTAFHLIWTTVVLSILVIIIAVWMASYLSNKLQWLIDGITKFRRGHRNFRFSGDIRDEFGQLAHSFNDMAENVVRSVHTPLVITDMNRNIIYVNEQCLDVLGQKTLQDVIGQPYEKISIYGYGSKCCPITALKENREAEVRYLKSHNRYVRGIANYLLDEHGEKQGYIITSNDVTDISLQRIELERAKMEAELASQHKSRFLAKMSHDLRTPMNAILGLNELTQVQIASMPNSEALQELNKNLDYLKSSSQRLLLLLNDILEVSNLENGDVTLVDRPLDMTAMLDALAAETKKKCEEKHLEWITNFDFTSTHFRTDSLRLRQIIRHLLNNAVKYTPEHGKVTFTVKQKASENHMTQFSFTVKDTGIGIPADMLARVCNPFEHVENVQYPAGSGLGLAIIQKTLALFGTQITVQSTENQGSEFSFDLWLQEDEGTTEEPSGIEVIRKLFTGCKALVVDDVRLNRIVLVNSLHDAGLLVDEAKDGKEALEMFANSPENTYDIIFMDIQMPVMNGYEAAKAIRKIPRQDAQEISIITISANAFREDIEKSRASGMNAHYAKPIQRGTLFDILMKFCKPKSAEPVTK